MSHSERYKAYMRSPEWRAVRKQALQRARYRCSWCGLSLKQLRMRGRHLQVHHNNYSSLEHERPEDLTVLCAGRGGCHAVADRQRRAAAGRKPAVKRKRSGRRRKRLGKTARAVLGPPVALIGVICGLKIMAVVLPYVS